MMQTILTWYKPPTIMPKGSRLLLFLSGAEMCFGIYIEGVGEFVNLSKWDFDGNPVFIPPDAVEAWADLGYIQGEGWESEVKK